MTPGTQSPFQERYLRQEEKSELSMLLAQTTPPTKVTVMQIPKDDTDDRDSLNSIRLDAKILQRCIPRLTECTALKKLSIPLLRCTS